MLNGYCHQSGFVKSKKGVFLAAIILAMILQMIFTNDVNSSPLNHRIAGSTQYDTSAAIAKEGWSRSDYAILAYGENYPDALAATPLAKIYNAPILLTEKMSLTPVTKQALQDLKVNNVLIVGGTAVISPTIENQLKYMGINVTRLAGYDKYDTAIQIALLLGKVSNISKISVVTGDDFADALSVASISAMNNSPIILAPKDQLTDSIKHYLSTTNITKTYVIGNADQISESVSRQFPNSERIAGIEKYARNIAILKKFDSEYDLGTIFLATGNGYADALSGAAYAAKISAPIVLVDKNTLSGATNQYINSKLAISKNLCVLGGEAVIPNSLIGNILNSPLAIPIGQTLKVSYIDVGEGDSILIQAPTGKNILIDGGKTDQTTIVSKYLYSIGVSTLDYVIATHADPDHIGSLNSVIKDFRIGKIYRPNATNKTNAFGDLLSAMQSKGLTFNETRAGGTLDLGAGLEADFIGPVRDDPNVEGNNYSAVLRLKYGSTSFLFTGDAETKSESDMIASGADLQSTVLKVGNHGSKYSTSDTFLNMVKPKYAVISVGANSLGHPTDEVLSRLSQHGISVFRTDVSGTIVAISDGTNVTFRAQPSTTSTPTTPTLSTNLVKISYVDSSADIVTITNNGNSPVDLTGWKLVNEHGSQNFEFPSGTIIPAIGTLKIVSGPEAVTGTDALFWTNSKIWLNSETPATLYGSQGQVLSRYPQ